MNELADDLRYRLLKYVDEHPNASQRELARELGVSVGKVNYCLKALIGKGWVKLQNFRANDRKSGYVYLLTKRGIEEKVNVTYSFLRRKVAEFENLQREIAALTDEVRALGQHEVPEP